MIIEKEREINNMKIDLIGETVELTNNTDRHEIGEAFTVIDFDEGVITEEDPWYKLSTLSNDGKKDFWVQACDFKVLSEFNKIYVDDTSDVLVTVQYTGKIKHMLKVVEGCHLSVLVTLGYFSKENVKQVWEPLERRGMKYSDDIEVDQDDLWILAVEILTEQIKAGNSVTVGEHVIKLYK